METGSQKPFTQQRQLILQDRAAGLAALEIAHTAYLEESGELTPEFRCDYAAAKIDGGDPEGALPEARQALKQARSLGDLQTEARSLLLCAICHWSAARFEAASELLDQARGVLPASAKLEAAGVEELQGLIHLGLGELELAVQCLQSANDYLRHLDDSERLARNGINLVGCFFRVGDLRRAQVIGLEVRRALKHSSDERSKFILAFNLASVFVKVKDWHAAEQEVKLLRECQRQLGKEVEQVGVDCLAAKVALNRGDSEAALRLAQRVASCPEGALSSSSSLSQLSVAAGVLRKLNQLEQADACYERALKAPGVVLDDAATLDVLVEQLELWLALGRLEEVEAALGQMVSI